MSSPTDAEVLAQVKDALYADVRLVSHDIRVQVENGVVTLTGTVPDAQQKALARVVVERLKGVERVINALEVVPPDSRPDAEITADIVAALSRDRLLNPETIEVVTVDGIVYLRGIVPSYAARRAAEMDARAIPGVLDVVNELVVAPAPGRPDSQIAREVRENILSHLRLDPDAVQVEVRHGVVFLRGAVPSQMMRWLVEEVVRWTPGVTDVVNELWTSPGAPLA